MAKSRMKQNIFVVTNPTQADFEKIANEAKITNLQLDVVTDKELSRIFKILENNSTIKSLVITGISDNLTEETITALVDMIQNNLSLIEIDLESLSLDEDYEELLTDAIKKNSNLRKITLNIDTNTSYIDSRNKILIQNIAFLIQEELIPQLSGDFAGINHSIVGLNIFNALKGSPKISYQVLYQMLEHLKQEIEDFETNNRENKDELYDPETFKKIPGLIAQINDLIEFMEFIKNISAELGMNLLHFAAHHGLTNQIEQLLKSGSSPDTFDDDHNTPLFYAIKAKKQNAIPLLEKTTINNENKAVNEESESENVVLDDTTKKLYLTFGLKKLESNLQEMEKNYIEGGDTKKSYEILIDYLKKYKHQLNNAEQLQIDQIIQRLTLVPEPPTPINDTKTFLEFFRIEKEKEIKEIENITNQLLNAKENTAGIISAGFIGHEIGASIEKQGDKFVLCLADRGGYLSFSEHKGNKFASVKSLTFDAKDLSSVVEKLYKANISPQEDALKILEKELPKITHSEYQESPISQSRYKGGICYFGNPKSILRYEFERHFGSDGYAKYKDFSYFMREQALADYAVAHPTTDNVQLRQEAAKILLAKKNEENAPPVAEIEKPKEVTKPIASPATPSSASVVDSSQYKKTA